MSSPGPLAAACVTSEVSPGDRSSNRAYPTGWWQCVTGWHTVCVQDSSPLTGAPLGPRAGRLLSYIPWSALVPVLSAWVLVCILGLSHGRLLQTGPGGLPEHLVSRLGRTAEAEPRGHFNLASFLVLTVTLALGSQKDGSQTLDPDAGP